jgi:hypothetical protein
MSYTTRLIADSMPAPASTPGSALGTPLDVDVEVIAPGPGPSMRPATVVEPVVEAAPLQSPSPPPPPAIPDEVESESTDWTKSDQLSVSSQRAPDRRDFEPAESVHADRPAVVAASPAPPSADVAVGQSRLALSASGTSLMSDTAVDRGLRVEPAEREPENPFDHANEGIPFRRLSGIDLVVVAHPADDRPSDAPELTPKAGATPPSSTVRLPERPKLDAREPEVEHLSLSIGSIEVIVDPPERPVAPVPVAPALPAPATSRAVADPIMQLRRQYVTWPDVD